MEQNKDYGIELCLNGMQKYKNSGTNLLGNVSLVY